MDPPNVYIEVGGFLYKQKTNTRFKKRCSFQVTIVVMSMILIHFICLR